VFVSKAGQHYWRLVRKLCNQTKIAAHRLDIIAQSRKQEITSLLKPRNTILANTRLPGWTTVSATTLTPFKMLAEDWTN